MARVASQNLFEILGDDDDIEAKVGLSNDTTPTKNETVAVQKHVDRSRASPKESRLRHEYPQFGNSDNRSGPRDLNVGRRHQDNDNNYNNNNYQSRSSRGSRPGERDRGRGGGRGGRGGREFDRHSGSGRYNNEKNESKSWESDNADWGNNYRTNSIDKIDNNDNSNAFSSGWEPDNNGNAADDSSAWNVTESQEPTNEWGSNDQNGDGGDGGGGSGGVGDWDAGKVETPSWEIQDEPTFEASGADNKNNKDLGEDEAATKPVETEEVVKTLEEYLSEKAQKVLDISLPEVRKPNEGVDDSQWKDAVPLEKKEDGDILFSGKEYSFKIKNKTKKSKNFLEIKPTFDKPVGFQRGGRGGGGRGRGRGGGGDRNRDDYDNRDNRRGDGGGERRSYDNNRDNRRGDGGGGERSYDNNRDNRRGGGGGERSYDNYNNNRRGGERSYDGYNNRENRRGGNGNRSNYVNIDDQGAFPSLGTV